MANVLTNLAADIYTAADTVGREAVGFIPSVTMNAEATRAAKGDTIRAAFTQAATVNNISEHMTIPQGDDQTVDNAVMTLSKSRAVQIPYTGEDVLHLRNGAGYDTVYGDQIAQAMRALTNEMEADLFNAAASGARYASSAVGTSPFAFSASLSGLSAVGDARKQLIDSGCPMDDVSLVLNTAQGAAFRQVPSLLNVNQAGSDALQRQGVLLDVYGVAVRESSKSANHTIGTLGGTPLTDVTDAVGSTSIAVNGSTGTIVAGDVVQFGGAGQKYVAQSGFDGTGDITLNGSGLSDAVANDTAVAIEATHSKQVMFHRSAIELAMRAPALPNGGDAADDAIVIQDPHSGIVFEIRTYRGYRKSMIEVAATWGVKAWKGDFIQQIVAPLG